MLCLDANVVVQAITGVASQELTDLIVGWKKAGQRFVAPSLIGYEVFNALHRIRLADPARISMNAAVRVYSMFEFELTDDLDLHERAVEIAEQLAQPAVYDAHYLALAQRLGVDFWTSDQKLVNSVRSQLPWVFLAP